MNFKKAIVETEAKEGTPEAAVEYYKDNNDNIKVKLSQFSLLKTTDYDLEDFWSESKNNKLLKQFVLSTLRIGKKYGLSDEKTYNNFRKVTETLFKKNHIKPDIVLDMEPGYNFKGLYKFDKFSVQKVRYDKEEAKSSKRK